MRFLSFSVFIAIAIPLVASKSLYVHSSCKAKQGWDTYLSEAKNLAGRASERMSSGSDTDFANVLSRVMKTTAETPEGQRVKGHLDEITGLSELSAPSDLENADIRVFCDEDTRWQKKNRGWYDPINEMIETVQPSCQEVAKTKLGRVYEVQVRKKPTNHNNNRVVITICNLAFEQPATMQVPASLSDPLVTGEKLEGMEVEYLSSIVSSTIMHELAHAVSCENKVFEIEDLDNPNTAYGWTNVLAKDTDKAVKNADNYTFLGIWAGLADLGYTIVRIKDTDDQIVKDVLEGYVEEGKLYAYNDITKRDLIMIAKRFIA